MTECMRRLVQHFGDDSEKLREKGLGKNDTKTYLKLLKRSFQIVHISGKQWTLSPRLLELGERSEQVQGIYRIRAHYQTVLLLLTLIHE